MMLIADLLYVLKSVVGMLVHAYRWDKYASTVLDWSISVSSHAPFPRLPASAMMMEKIHLPRNIF